MLQAERFIGTWSLDAFEVQLADGTTVHAMGQGALGRLSYDADGRMSAMLSRADRTPLSVPRLEAYGRAPADEKVLAFDSFMAYAGRYTVEEDAVVHHVELASVPNIVGARQRREACFDGDALVLRYVVTSSRGTRTNILRWRRL